MWAGCRLRENSPSRRGAFYMRPSTGGPLRADMEPAPTMYFPKLQTPRKRHAFGAFLFVIGKLQLFFRLFRKGDHPAMRNV